VTARNGHEVSGRQTFPRSTQTLFVASGPGLTLLSLLPAHSIMGWVKERESFPGHLSMGQSVGPWEGRPGKDWR